MKLSRPPDLSSNRSLGAAALAVTLIAAIGLILHNINFAKTLGDPDDAMRLVLVRDLMAGHGWYDQLVTRLQPPVGVYLHWSRLLDGVLAGLTKLFEMALSPTEAEIAMRFSWPLLLIFPAVICALAIARRLGGSLAVFICAVLLASNLQAFAQFIPGRIDHHNIQIVLVLVAAACAMTAQHRSRWALLAGISSALGLAIGIEGLPFHVVVGASYAILAATGHDEGRTTRNYALSLLVASVAFYCLQTPPWRWTMSFCDAIGLNLIAAIAIAAGGLLALTATPKSVSTWGRLVILAATVLLAAGTYLGFDPACVRGPVAAVDPRIRPFWFDLVDEMQPLLVITRRHLGVGAGQISLSIMSITAVAYFFARNRYRVPFETALASALVLVAALVGYYAFRMESYTYWLGFPLLAYGFSLIAARFLGGLMVPVTIFCVLLSPIGIGTMAQAGALAAGSPKSAIYRNAVFLCAKTADYHQLASLPSGVVLADISLGPYILANTQDAVLNAPYHRMAWGILAAHSALSAPTSKAEKIFRGLKINYLVECSSRPGPPTPGSIEADLLHGSIPDWLRPLSNKNQTIQIYRVQAKRTDVEPVTG